MIGSEVLTQMADIIEERRWDDLPALLHREFRCRYVHTDETFDRDTWVRLNAEYPGFQHFVLEDCVGDGNRAAGRAHVTSESDGHVMHFEVATFITLREGVIGDMTEVWADIDEVAPIGTRPE